MEDNAKITKQVMEQYEKVRKSGVSNMFDVTAVLNYAAFFGYEALANLSRKDYIDIISNFSHYMKKYGIEQ